VAASSYQVEDAKHRRDTER